MTNPSPHQITVLIRFHTVSRLQSLDEALFSLLTQRDVLISAVILCQHLSEADYAAVDEVAALYRQQALDVSAINEHFAERGDHRAELLNRGLSRTVTRYLAFLDCDDVVYPTCYTRLTARLCQSDAALAFGGVLRSDQFKSGDAVHVKLKFRPIPDLPKLLFFRCNQYPIHSYVIDLQRIDRTDAYFDVGHSRNEDYAFLVRLLSKYQIDTRECRRIHCEYRVDIDGENTIPIYHADDSSNKAWALSEAYVDDIKSRLNVITTSPDIVHLIAWCESNTRAVYASEIQGLQNQVEALRQELNGASLNAGKTPLALSKFLNEFDADQTDNILSLNIESADWLDATTCRVRGWCAGRSSTPVMMACRYRTTPLERDLATYAEFLHRQDVADHLGVEDAHFGFEIDVLRADSVDLVCLCSDGKIYKGSLDVSGP